MDTVKTIRKRVVSLTTGLLTLLLIIWFMTPHQRIVAGVFLGLCVSLYNVLNLLWKMKPVKESAVYLKPGRYRGVGIIHRYLMVALAIIIAVKFPEWIDPRAIVAGLPVCYIFLYCTQFIQVIRSSS
ncbi:ATP synthase subunit I [Thermoactinomyces intermedius]|jgi:ATP synthase protein I|uniref:ATP synthase subunit I n=1 Tax=Thermoactinomyces intermedius TaxID=2024 RepID=A0A8I1AFB1_THEIN|nr:ATP synthase subunit I [Thermoactinomyces sp. CICC 23799]MBA4548134.1 ATP synthase subunit I [Thermoactinomyces intermedius]MBA4835302.1 ATP synthase subunit I [Thermoactinomyces intermedius]MBH8594978.1 ATP synthase subunit I [Thermoactinomyces intermedius]MBH8600362.1 ATP synthase subunit I [Thermoactinomyces sp. CICC 23799]